MTDDADAAVLELFNSVEGAAFLEQLMAAWRASGWDVRAVSAVSEADYRRPRGRAGQLALRARMYAGYAWQCRRETRRTGTAPRVRVVTTNPFFAPALVAACAREPDLTVNLLYDLYPEALVNAGVVKADSWLATKAAAVTRYALRNCAATVFLGERLRRYAEGVHGVARHGVVIPVGADGIPFRDAPPRALGASERVRVLYCGQMGQMHDVATVAGIWRGEAAPDVEWRFHASGAGYSRLQREVGNVPSVTWGGSLDGPAWRDAMTAAQVALVTMSPGAERVVMPSKTYSALVAGQAILAVCPRNSDLADLVALHDCGWVVEPGDTTALREVLSRLSVDRRMLDEKRRNAYAAGHDHYCVTKLARAWLELFEEIGAPAPRPLVEAI